MSNVSPLLNNSNVLGFIFLYKWSGDPGRETESNTSSGLPPNIYFAKQLVKDACATHAILSILLNADCQMSDHLCEFKRFTQDFDPSTKGLAIGNTDFLRIAHNSFAPFPSIDEEEPVDQDKASYHFVSFVPCLGETYELDGLKDLPICHGKIKETFPDHVVEIVKDRIDRF